MLMLESHHTNKIDAVEQAVVSHNENATDEAYTMGCLIPT